MKKIVGAAWLALAALAAAACAGDVHTDSAGTSGATSSTTSGTGGSCSVSLPVGCGCPDHAGPWAQRFGVAGDDAQTDFYPAGALPLAPDGSVVLSLRTLNAAGTEILSARLVKLDAAGHTLWDQPWEQAVSIPLPAPDPRDCSTLVTGTISAGATTLLGQTLTCGTAYCPFVARIDAAGALGWVKVYDFGGDAWTTPSIAGVLPDGRIALVGPFQGTIDLGNGPLSVPDYPSSGVFVALLSPAGDALWSRHFTKEGKALGSYFAVSAVVSPAGDITVATSPDGAVDFGEGALPAPGASVNGGLALASYDPTGALRFGRVIVSPDTDTDMPSLVRDSAGHLIIAETVGGMADFGGGPVGAPGPWHTAVAAFDADGQYLWSTALEATFSGGLAVDAADHLRVGTAAGELAELDPGGALVAMHPIGGSGARAAWAVGFAPGGAPVIAGTFEATLDLGTGALTAKSKHDTFVAALAP